mmetsp:Transcript_77170/g.218380  ORF Transcript_77170/g.218380 Transcript_77170/m.218380 type:complete len:262 (-) Transcript_77170:199-984(-)
MLHFRESRVAAVLAAALLLSLAVLASTERPAAPVALGQDGGAALAQGWFVLLDGAQLVQGLFGAPDYKSGRPDSDKGAFVKAWTLALVAVLAGGLRLLEAQTDRRPGAQEGAAAGASGAGERREVAGGASAAVCGSEGAAGLQRSPGQCTNEEHEGCEYGEFMDKAYEDLLYIVDPRDLVSTEFLPVERNQPGEAPEIELGDFSDSEDTRSERFQDMDAELEEALAREFQQSTDREYESAMDKEYGSLLSHYLQDGRTVNS